MIGLVLAGVFVPTFSRQILDGVLLSAIFIVAVLWTVTCAARRRKCCVRTPVVELPVAPSSPAEALKPDNQEGGQSNA